MQKQTALLRNEGVIAHTQEITKTEQQFENNNSQPIWKLKSLHWCDNNWLGKGATMFQSS